MNPDCVLMVGMSLDAALDSNYFTLPDAEDQSRAYELSSWLERVMPVTSRRMAVVLPKDMALPSWINDVLRQHWHRAAIAQLTITKNGGTWGRNFLRTLMRSPAWALAQHGEPWRGLPAFIVGAGSSLDGNGHLLVEAQKRGPIIALNSSAGCCRHHGVEPDLIVCCEAVPLAEHLHPFGQTTVALDALAAPENWNAAQSTLAFGLHEPYLARYMVDLEIPPLHYSTSSATAAMSLATWWGADTLVMVGQDNGTSNGRPYGLGSPFADMRGTVRDGLLCYEGKSKHPYQTPVVMRPGWQDGEPVPTDHTFDGVLTWTEGLATRATVINATEGGVSIRGTIETPLSDTLAALEPRKYSVPAGKVVDATGVIEAIKRQAEQHLDRDQPDPTFSLIHMWTVPAALGVAKHRRRETLRDVTRAAAAEILEVIG